MLLKITDGQALDERRLMDVYAESNLENTDFFCSEEPDKEAAVRISGLSEKRVLQGAGGRLLGP